VNQDGSFRSVAGESSSTHGAGSFMTALRSRVIRHGFWLNGDLCALSRDARLLFVGLWCLADRDGRLDGRPMQIRRHLFPFDADLNGQRIETLLADLERAGFILKYEVSGENFILVRNFKKHQSPHPKEAQSKLPAHPSGTQVESNLDPGGISLSSKANFASGPSGPSEPSKPRSASPRVVADSPKANAARARKRPAREIPAEWNPNQAHARLAAELGLSVVAECPRFRDFHTAKGSVFADWDAAFRTWLRNAQRFGVRATAGAPQSTRSERIMSAGAEALRLVEEAERRKESESVP